MMQMLLKACFKTRNYVNCFYDEGVCLLDIHNEENHDRLWSEMKRNIMV